MPEVTLMLKLSSTSYLPNKPELMEATEAAHTEFMPHRSGCGKGRYAGMAAIISHDTLLSFGPLLGTVYD